MTRKNLNAEIKFRLGEFIFIQMVNNSELSDAEFEEARDQLLNLYHPIIGELERGLPCKVRKHLK